MEVSVLVPTFNRVEFLKTALDSIASQSFHSWKVIVYDDGSTDNTSEVVKDFKKRFPETIYLKSNVNMGVGFARNQLLGVVDTPYCIWQDSDDVSHPHRLESMLEAIKQQKADIVFSHMYFFRHPVKHTATRTIHKIDISKYTTRDGLHNNMNFATGIFKSELKKFKFRSDMRRREDAQWLADLISARVKFGYFPKPLYYCRRHSGRLTNGHRFSDE